MKNKLKIIIPIAAAIAAVITALVCVSFKPQNKTDMQSVLQTAQKYLVELNYEQAIAEFKKVLEIEAMNVDAYLGIAEAYERSGDIPSALEWLRKGHNLTSDERLEQKIDKLFEKSSENPEDLTENNEGYDVTKAENTSVLVTEETTDNFEEEIRAKAISVIEMFDVYKRTGKPNSEAYFHLPTDLPHGYLTSLTKCIYDENGNLMLTYETGYSSDSQSCAGEIIVHNWDKHSTEFYTFNYTDPDMSGLKKTCYKKCFLNTDYIMDSLANVDLAHCKFKGITDNCYSFLNPLGSEMIKIYVDSNSNIINITVEDEWSVREFSLENNNWISTYSTSLGYSRKFYPCENILPDGTSDEDFAIPTVDSESCKTFYSWKEYNDYVI